MSYSQNGQKKPLRGQKAAQTRENGFVYFNAGAAGSAANEQLFKGGQLAPGNGNGFTVCHEDGAVGFVVPDYEEEVDEVTSVDLEEEPARQLLCEMTKVFANGELVELLYGWKWLSSHFTHMIARALHIQYLHAGHKGRFFYISCLRQAYERKGTRHCGPERMVVEHKSSFFSVWVCIIYSC